MAALFSKDWLRRVNGERELRVTVAGEQGLRALLGIEAAGLLQSRVSAEPAAVLRRAASR